MTAAAVAVGQIKQTIAPSNTSLYSTFIGTQSKRAANIIQENNWISNNHPCHAEGTSSRGLTLQKVSNS